MAGLRRLLASAAALTALAGAGVNAQAYTAGSLPDGPGSRATRAEVLTVRILKDETEIDRTRTEAVELRNDPPAEDYLTNLAIEFDKENADVRYRDAIRREQQDLLDAAAEPDVAEEVVSLLPDGLSTQVQDALQGWYALWRLAGIDEFDKVRIHPRPLGAAAPEQQLIGIYQDAGGRYQVDWSVLASINYIESDFGRVNGPSSAGALGPMQFMPATWQEYGTGDVMNPHDAIWAAARYLFLHGAVSDIGHALFAYNHDWDYVTAIESYADAMRRDPAWAERFYYWTTTG